MSSFAVLTSSYGPDLELCCTPNRSVLEWTPLDVQRHIIVPRRDLDLFGSLRSPRTELWTVEEMLPRRMVRVPKVNAWLC